VELYLHFSTRLHDVGKYSFVNRTIQNWNQLPAEGISFNLLQMRVLHAGEDTYDELVRYYTVQIGRLVPVLSDKHAAFFFSVVLHNRSSEDCISC
jgi:hypothetical protein